MVSGLFVFLINVWAAAPAAAAPVLIDGFTEGSFNLTSTGSTVGTDHSGVDTLDGWRALLFRHNGSESATATLSPGGPVTVSGGSSMLTFGYGYRYSGGGALQGGINTRLGADLSTTTGIEFDFGSLTGQVNIIVSLVTAYPGGSNGYLNNGNAGDPVHRTTTAGKFVVPYSGLRTPSGYNSVDLSKIDSISVTLYGTNFTLNSITAVPEPALGGVLMAGLATMTLARRRRPDRRA